MKPDANRILREQLIITTTQLCQILGITRETVRRMEYDGILKPIMLGKSAKHYRTSDIKRLLGV